MKKLLLCLFILLVPFVYSFAAEVDDGVFTASGVQFEINTANYASEEAFFGAVEQEIAVLLDAEYRPDLIIFPEYIGVFYQLIDFNEIVRGYQSFHEALVAVLLENPQFENMADLFLVPEAWTHYLEGWSRLAEKYSVNLIAGSCFISDNSKDLYNRTFVFGSDGELDYSQNKVFLTEFETDIIGLSAGSLDDAGFFEIAGQDLALTICRDAYSPEWEQKHAGAFLWIDIKANGESYNDDQRRSFMRALPLRLVRSDVNFGMTVCAVGSYLDLFWEGESSAIYKQGAKLALADISDSFNSADSVSISIVTKQ